MVPEEQSKRTLRAAMVLFILGAALVIAFCVVVWWPATLLLLGATFLFVSYWLDVPKRPPTRR
jgi:1,4-dihydroxy-2-naphthoate octaprenyltransferase